MAVFATLAKEINAIQQQFVNSGFQVKILNLGGGLGVDYDQPDENPIPDYNKYFEAYLKNLEIQPGQELHFELGRSVVAACGSLISKVLYLKNSGGLQFAIIDAGMNDLIRPALYKAKHKIQNLTGIGTETEYQVAGPICESSDIFGKNISLPQLTRGDLLTIRTAGAYGEVMSSTYNLRQPAKAFYSTEFPENARKINISIHNKNKLAKALNQ
jgi:diaminopimelate decarboxylase